MNQFKLGKMRKPDMYTVNQVSTDGTVVVLGERTAVSLSIESSVGHWNSKDTDLVDPHWRYPEVELPQEFIDWVKSDPSVQRLSDPKQVLTYFQDPGHGWLRVPFWMLEKLKIEPTTCSYRSNQLKMAYLEEDLDMGSFLKAFSAFYGFDPMIKEQFIEDRIFIRNLDRFQPASDNPSN